MGYDLKDFNMISITHSSYQNQPIVPPSLPYPGRPPAMPCHETTCATVHIHHHENVIKAGFNTIGNNK